MMIHIHRMSHYDDSYTYDDSYNEYDQPDQSYDSNYSDDTAG